ncbi:MAG: hypothetical protein ACPG7F_11095 [Aggregatilineales bacterium]
MSFFKKLNTLVQSHINDVLDPMDDTSVDARERRQRRNLLSRREIQSGLTGDVKELRTRIDEAVAYEDQLQGKIEKLYSDIARYDAAADEALARADDTAAQRAVSSLKQAQRELEMQEADVREHRFITQELVSKVNQLESTLETAKRQQAEELRQAESDNRQEKITADNDTDRTSIPLSVVEEDDQGNEVVREISRKLDNTRQKLSELVATQGSGLLNRADDVVDEVKQPEHPVSRRDIRDDLAERRSRLSAPPKKSNDDDK